MFVFVLLQVLAPSDQAFDNLLTMLGGGQKLPIDALLKLQQLKDIVMYHIVPGEYTSGKSPFNAVWTYFLEVAHR